jgi:hypothetical protein
MGRASSEEEGGRRMGVRRWGGVIAGRGVADGCKSIYFERVRRYCSGSEARERDRD